MRANELKTGRNWLIRLETDQPLHAQIRDAGAALGVEAATFTVLGAVQNAVLRYYDQSAKEYRDFALDRHLELLSGVGNFSLKDGSPFVHCHVTLGADDGTAWGGHLHEERSSAVFAAELWLQELLGEPPVRMFDERCGLMLWS